MLATEPAAALAAHRVAPDDFVDELAAAKQPIERNFDVMDGSVIEVHEQRAGRGEHAAALGEIRAQPGDEGLGIVSAVGIRVAAAVPDGAGGERWIDVDRSERAIAERGQLGERIAQHQTIGRGSAPKLDDVDGSGNTRRARLEGLEGLGASRGVLFARHLFTLLCEDMRFGPWYPLAEARDHAPAAEGVWQLRLASGLVDYPRGKSAMVHYGHATDVGVAAQAWAAAHGTDNLVCRHLIEVDAATDLAAFHAKLSDEFVRRFGELPQLARSQR